MKLESLIYEYQHRTGDAYQDAKRGLADHAANVLPELLSASRDLIAGGAKQKTTERLQAAIAAAEEVKPAT